MKTITKEMNLYKFNELSQEVKEMLLKEYCEMQTEIMNEHFLKDEFIYLINELEPRFEVTNVYWSLSYCQGDGVMFEGVFDNVVEIEQQGHYSHSYCSVFNWLNDNIKEEDIKNIEEKYHELCDQLTKKGYDLLYYDYTLEEVEEYYNEEDIYFTKNGRVYYE